MPNPIPDHCHPVRRCSDNKVIGYVSRHGHTWESMRCSDDDVPESYGTWSDLCEALEVVADGAACYCAPKLGSGRCLIAINLGGAP